MLVLMAIMISLTMKSWSQDPKLKEIMYFIIVENLSWIFKIKK